MTLLRHELETRLAGWQQDLSPGWRTFFGDTAPDFAAFGEQFTFPSEFPMIPPRKGTALPGSPAGAHIFRAFDGIEPDAVRVIVIGQDPYPNIARATGRAFEDGALVDWASSVAPSLKSLAQSALALRLNQPDLAENMAAWSKVRSRITDGSLSLETVKVWFDRLQQANGVLFVNAGWTLTRFSQPTSLEQKAHVAMWKPLMNRLMHGLTARNNRATAFLLLGGFAKDLFDKSGVESAARAAGRWDTAARRVDHPHPNAVSYFAKPNPLQRINAALAAMGAPQVDW